MIRHFDNLPQEKKSELFKIQGDLDAIRHRLDDVMYGGNSLETPMETITDLRRVYSAVCSALDEF